MGYPMKTNKNTPSAKGGKTTKVTPVTKGSPSLKATPGFKNLPNAKAAPALKTTPVKVLPSGASAPQDKATLPAVVHSPGEIAIRAYHNFQKRGAADGNHTDDWLRAEAELTSEQRIVRS